MRLKNVIPRLAGDPVIKQEGQGLLEATIAIGIIVVGVLSIFAVGTGQLRAIHVAEDRLIAGDLAREGIEIVRSIRDSNWLKGSGAGWTKGIGDGSGVSGILVFSDTPDVDGSRWALVPGVTWNTDAAFLYDDGTLYRQSSAPKAAWRKTSFQRMIAIEPTSADSRRVTVEVRWGSIPSPIRVIAETVLWNWK